MSVSRETEARLDCYIDHLFQWQAVKNLVSPSTLPDVWSRHILDSAQLLPLLKGARQIVDFGSGAGFPGLVLAILLMDKPDPKQRPGAVHLIESNSRKAAFLQEVAQATGAPATVHPIRIEEFVRQRLQPPFIPMDFIVARALAPLRDLIALSEGLLKTGGQALFLKGQDVERELTEASKSWILETQLVPSVTDVRGRIVHIKRATRRI